ncbi:MAG: HAMP domain-containing sensor histidine kinase [Bryobacteraceae bacterium]
MRYWSDPETRRRWVSWILLATLGGLCVALAAIQYRSLREVNEAEGFRRREALEASLRNAANQFDNVLSRALRSVVREAAVPDPAEWEQAYSRGYLRWRESGSFPGIFAGVYRLMPGGPDPETARLRRLGPDGSFADASWPAGWEPIRERLAERKLAGNLFGPIVPGRSAVIEIPRFLPGAPGERREPAEWLLFEIDTAYAAKTLLPEIVRTQLTERGVRDFDVQVRSSDGAEPLFLSGSPIGAASKADASVRLFEVRWNEFSGDTRRPQGFGPEFRPGGEGKSGPRPDFASRRGGGAPPPRPSEEPRRGGPRGGRWELLARHQSGSLEAAVSRAHFRNAALTGSILLLILGGSLAFMQFNRNAQRLAELQVEFISGISHELRTPLSVITSAAFNLKRGVVKDAEQTKKYGEMIHAESERLAAIVEQVLRFARTRSGSVLATREPMAPGHVVEEAIGACSKTLTESGCTVETAIEPELPPVEGDSVALRQAIQNLIGNAAKYGWEGGWIGIFALAVTDPKGREWVEIRVADRGPGIPAAEIERIFTPFFRGKRAVDDQVHGTGLGLNLARKIVEAHGGSISARSQAGRETEFVVRIPAIPVEKRDEFANIAG